MRIKLMGLLFIAVLMTMSGVNRPASAQEVISGNLLINPGFEEGYYYQDNIPQIAAPNGWRYVWLDNQPFAGTNGQPAYRPETVVWNIEDAPPHERTVLFRDGSYTVKVFRNWAPILTALTQDVTGLEVGRKYRISAPIFIDMIEDYEDGQKVPPDELWTAFIRLGAGPTGANWLDDSQVAYSPHWSAENVNPFFLSMPTFTWDFVATQPNMTIFIEFGVKQPLVNGGFFIDGVGLYALSQVNNAPPAGSGNSGSGSSGSAGTSATATPIEVTPREDGSIVHVVGPNDSFWTIAIQYAPVLGIPAEQALTQIQELNGNPQFVIAGQELLIREAGNFISGGTPEADAQPTAAAGEGTPAPETTPESEAETIVVEGEPLAPAAEATPTAEQSTTSVCVSTYDDMDGNGQLDAGTDTLKADVAVTLFKDGQTISTYVSDGVSNEQCFENLEPGAYQVQLYPPVNYVPTTADSWTMSVEEGTQTTVQFGVQIQDTEAVADAGNTDIAPEGTAGAELPTPTAALESSESTAQNGTFLNNLGVILIVAAVVLVLLAGAGVVMLRRG
jgi:hypothetical protein